MPKRNSFFPICHGFIVLAATVASDPAYACTCAYQTAEEAINSTDAIFEGRVVKIQTGADKNSISTRMDKIHFRVVRSWKGVREEQLVLRTAKNEAGCGYPFRTNQSYLVYANAGGTGLHVGLCSRTKPIEEAEDDLNALGIGEVPVSPRLTKEEKQVVAPPTQPAEQAGCASCHVLRDNGRYPGALVVWLIILFTYYRFRKRSRLKPA